LQQRRPGWLAHPAYADAINRLRRLYPSGARGLWRFLTRPLRSCCAAPR
jgi:hypothetical protein